MKRNSGLLKNSRSALGLTQSEMAAYLGVNLSQFSMAEGDRRELPSAGGLQHAYLTLSMIAKPTAEYQLALAENDKEQQAVLKKWAADELVDCKFELYQLSKKLENYKVRAEQGLLLLHTTLHRAANPQKEDNKKRSQIVLNRFNVLAKEELQKYGMTEQEKLAFRIDILERQIAGLEQMIKK